MEMCALRLIRPVGRYAGMVAVLVEIIVEQWTAGVIRRDEEVALVRRAVGEGNGGLGAVAENIEDGTKQRRFRSRPARGLRVRPVPSRPLLSCRRSGHRGQAAPPPAAPGDNAGRCKARAGCRLPRGATASAVLGRNRPCASSSVPSTSSASKRYAVVFAIWRVLDSTDRLPFAVSARRSYQGRPSRGKPRRTEDCNVQKNGERGIKQSGISESSRRASGPGGVRFSASPGIGVLVWIVFLLAFSSFVILPTWDCAILLNRDAGRMTKSPFHAKMGQSIRELDES